MSNLSARFCFHNIGQGGFYSGSIKKDGHDFNFVYDCGTLSGHEFLIDAISEMDESVYSSQKLNLLVLSHLDADHVNGISDLLTSGNVHRINILVMPYMTLLDRTILLSFYVKRKYYESDIYYEFLIDPIGFFVDKDIRVDHIVFLNDEPDNYEENENNPLPFDSPGCEFFGRENKKGKEKIYNENHLGDDWKRKLCCVKGFKIYFSKIWKFEFWCDCRNIDIDVYEEVMKKINALGLDVNDVETVKNAFANNRKALAECYENIKKKPNDMSVVLFHYPLVKNVRLAIRKELMKPFGNWCPFSCVCNPLIDVCTHVNATLLLGDINLKSTLDYIWTYFKLWERDKKVIICTVPHHGSRHNWKREIMERCEIGMFVVSSGVHGRFKHPHKEVVRDFKELVSPMLIWNNEYSKIDMMVCH